MQLGRIALGAVVLVAAAIVPAAPARAQEGTAPVSTASEAAAARRIVLEYKAGEVFPLRLFEGVDLLEPIVPVVATDRGDWGRVFYNSVVPYSLAAAAFTLRGKDRDTLREVGRWKWVAVDAKMDNNLMLGGLIALGAASIFLPSPVDGDGYEWQLRADRMAVFAIGMLATELETDILKNVMKRRRPDGSDRKSRPSGHASSTAAAMSFMADVLRDTFRPQDEPNLLHRIWKEAVCGVPYLGVAYVCLERIHGKKHYLTDTLLGAALGAFTMHMLYSWSFTELEQRDSWLRGVSFGYNPEMKGLEFAIRGEF